MAYFNSSKAVDKLPLIPILFEDDIGHNKISKMIDEMNKDLISKNQQTLKRKVNRILSKIKKNKNL